MKLVVRLFAACREKVQTDRVELDFGSDSISLEDLKRGLEQAKPALAGLLRVSRVAVNQSFADETTVVRVGDEVAIIPPVSGGSGQGPFEVREAVIELAEVEQAVRSREAGAVVTFSGTVRAATHGHVVTALEYESYREMAEAFLRKIGGEIEDRWPGARSAILHRVGRLEVGEVAVVIAVASAHRKDAFEGCRHAIERIKEDVPIWKKELRADGSVWVGMGS
jgi:molybdopterin synthase catalytic subunit